jgi:pseudouridine-5'-phosphate glycosidase
MSQLEMGINSALLIANPIPLKDEIPLNEVDSFIRIALKECEKNNISGKHVTPFLLKKIVELSGKKSLAANISLALNNVRLAIEIAKAIK